MSVKEDADEEYVVIGVEMNVPADETFIKQLNMDYLQLIKDTE
tara:strand:+ start:127 stop:255 length:129 start_codon:yes stop_codon:yes gene_type:complete